VLENVRFEGRVRSDPGGTIKELREVVALAETCRLTRVELEFAPLAAINAVGEVSGRVVLTP
jgi:hypothetical protein